MLNLMAFPKQPDARQFYRAAKQRFEDAEVLLKAQRTTGAIYLAGYCVECMLKALIIARSKTPKQFRGEKGHDFESLKAQYFQSGGTFPRVVSQAFARVTTWKVSGRYESRTAKFRDAEVFMESVRVIMEWIERSI